MGQLTIYINVNYYVIEKLASLKKQIQITRRMVDYRIIQNCNKQQQNENKDQEKQNSKTSQMHTNRKIKDRFMLIRLAKHLKIIPTLA